MEIEQTLQLRYPVDNPVVTQTFGANPDQYIVYGFPGHEGIDFGGKVGDPIHATLDGTVKLVAIPGQNVGKSHNYGKHIRIVSVIGGQQYESIYAHLNEIQVFEGAEVKAGDVIAEMGSTGRSTGPHLHFTLKKLGATNAGETRYPKDVIDPAPYFMN